MTVSPHKHAFTDADVREENTGMDSTHLNLAWSPAHWQHQIAGQGPLLTKLELRQTGKEAYEALTSPLKQGSGYHVLKPPLNCGNVQQGEVGPGKREGRESGSGGSGLVVTDVGVW